MVPLYLLAVTHRNPFVQNVDGVIALARDANLSHRGQFAYSNLGGALLGHALAAASNMDYGRLVQERIFTPLGMTASSIPLTSGSLPEDAPTGYSVTGKAEPPWTMNGWAPAGGIRSTPADVVRYAQALLNGSAPGMDALTPRWESGESGAQKVGYAWFTEEIEGRMVTWHDGGTGGFASIIVLDRASHRAVIVLSNTNASVNDAGIALLMGEE
jgi:CubicO group peptidase (beta-lactamase class C family)